MARSVQRPTSAQVMISQSVSSSPASGSVLTAQSLEPASDSVSLSPFLPTRALSLSLSLSLSFKNKQKFKNNTKRGVWVAQSVKCPTSAPVMISWFMSLSPVSGSMLTARSLEPASDSVSPSLSDPPPIHALSLSVSKINKR